MISYRFIICRPYPPASPLARPQLARRLRVAVEGLPVGVAELAAVRELEVVVAVGRHDAAAHQGLDLERPGAHLRRGLVERLHRVAAEQEPVLHAWQGFPHLVQS